MHFRAFVRSLEERGVDMSRVSISKSVREAFALQASPSHDLRLTLRRSSPFVESRSMEPR